MANNPEAQAKKIVEFIPVSSLKHIEGFSEKRVLWLKDKILREGIWCVPLKIDTQHHLVMDGQHRMEVATLLGLSVVPCICYQYDEVEVWSLRGSYTVTADEIIERSLTGNIYPYKTAKHRFPFGEEILCHIPIDQLR